MVLFHFSSILDRSLEVSLLDLSLMSSHCSMLTWYKVNQTRSQILLGALFVSLFGIKVLILKFFIDEIVFLLFKLFKDELGTLKFLGFLGFSKH